VPHPLPNPEHSDTRLKELATQRPFAAGERPGELPANAFSANQTVGEPDEGKAVGPNGGQGLGEGLGKGGTTGPKGKTKKRKRKRSRRRPSHRDSASSAKPWELPISNYERQRGYHARLKQAKLDAKGFHPFPDDTHLLQHPNPAVVDEAFSLRHRLLDHRSAKGKPWYSRKSRGELVTVNHWGQRKLLISEVEFLTRCVELGQEYTLLYAGAAPGSHLKFLADLFPQVRFVLVDPAPFSIEGTARLTILNEYMTAELASRYADTPNLLFISDVRTANPRVMPPDEVEERIRIDNQLQIDWIEKMDPDASLLKFRLPYYEEEIHKRLKSESKTPEDDRYINYKYFNGDIYLPVWGGQSTTECRLHVPKERTMKVYNTKRYQEQLFHFNTETRVQYYPHPVKSKGLCHCYDCRAEVHVLSDYLQKFKGSQEEVLVSELEVLIPAVSKRITPHKSRRNLSVVLPTKSGFIREDEYAWEKSYSEKLLLNAPTLSSSVDK